eukprot:TRINITY_DN9565_c0_g1_i1.p1 TRINITY_DN9565_c0_g1~~TRINITY_DN9565_c0_g1_i1.p1  ORF type:complete len:545 (-),score=101.59 TRINITY_DN9565_c0_g1_i1:196-1830(-)
METQKPQTPLLLRLERHCILPKYLKFFADMNMTEAEFAAYTNNALESDIKDYIHESVPQVILMRLKNVKDEINSEGFVNIQSQPSATPPFTLLNSPPLPSNGSSKRPRTEEIFVFTSPPSIIHQELPHTDNPIINYTPNTNNQSLTSSVIPPTTPDTPLLQSRDTNESPSTNILQQSYLAALESLENDDIDHGIDRLLDAGIKGHAKSLWTLIWHHFTGVNAHQPSIDPSDMIAKAVDAQQDTLISTYSTAEPLIQIAAGLEAWTNGNLDQAMQLLFLSLQAPQYAPISCSILALLFHHHPFMRPAISLIDLDGVFALDFTNLKDSKLNIELILSDWQAQCESRSVPYWPALAVVLVVLFPDRISFQNIWLVLLSAAQEAQFLPAIYYVAQNSTQDSTVHSPTNAHDAIQSDEVIDQEQRRMDRLLSVAAQGHAYSWVEIGKIYLLSRDPLHDRIAAYESFQKAALLKHPAGLFHVGFCLSTGCGVFRSVQKAKRSFIEGAIGGSADAQYNLAMIYHTESSSGEAKAKAHFWHQLSQLQKRAQY